MSKTMLGKYDYSGISQVCYSDNKQESYKKAAKFLGDTVEDWGGGTGWAKRYFRNYTNIDCSEHKNVDILVNLEEYTSDVDNILMRQVLELNYNWRKVLENAIKSFKKKFCLIVYTPFVKKTREGFIHKVYKNGKPDGKRTFPEIYFNKKDILEYFPKDKFKVKEDESKTKTGYRRDWILYVERIT